MRKKKNGMLVDREGNQYWFKNYQLHRENAPAIIFANGKKYWYKNDLLHREDGPAMEFWHGVNKWYIDGKELTQEQINAIEEKNQLNENINKSISPIKKIKL